MNHFLAPVFLFLSFAPVAVGAGVAPGVQLAHTYEHVDDVRDYFVSEKYDGVRGRWTGSALLTRNGHVIAAPEWFTRDWPDAIMDGELWAGRGRFDVASGTVRSQQADDDEWRKLRFMVFDLPAMDAPFSERVQRMRLVLDRNGIAWLQPVAQLRVESSDALDAMLGAIVAAGGEGLMLHHQDARYATGRSRQLLKYKPHTDAEARVLAHVAGKGKYAGMTGALLVERTDGVRFLVGSGLDDADRAEPPPIGSLITYRYNGYTANGLPRFPRFLRVRELPPTE